MIQFHQVSKYFAGKRAVDNLSLQISKGEFTVLIGTSGSGKSTTLKMINRLIEHDEGKIRFAGEEIRNYKPEDLRRRMGYAIQSIGLFPHWTVERNIATVPQLLKWPKDRIRQRVVELLNCWSCCIWSHNSFVTVILINYLEGSNRELGSREPWRRILRCY
ncbi:quaternary amine ABC transporter ATP-binding protein [Yersinia similis]|uniref:Quaternary amine ABC transporter ATP-binding protein n=1 Tax=Yersinia similis TaxID=367190 RepID=A0A0T9PVM9_9GAMM|nr:quaternary amine ABC transporter ATP-binding protein [Yersinia similis]